ncbi:MAG: molybdopterin oxidoreductase, partial [Magnetococcales bacterium]|nr:molybdopterin oxidoreductase [Magnetococcales bacterium]
SGTHEHFMGALEMLSGIPAKETWSAYQKHLQQGVNSPFSRACRDTAFQTTAARIHTTPKELEQSLAKRGVHLEMDRSEILKHHSMPRQMAMPTTSGRLEFYGNLFLWLQQMGGRGPAFNVLAAPMPAQCRDRATMADPLDKDEFYFTYGKTATVSYGSTNSNNPVLAGINRFKKDIYTGIWIHPDRAGPLGIKNGDRVRIKNTLSGQSADGTAYVTQQLHPDSMFMHSSFGVENKALRLSYGLGTASNKLIPNTIEPLVAGFRSQEFTVRIAKI